MRQALSRPERESQASLEIKECHRAILELLADDALRLEPEAAAIEGHGLLEVIDSKGQKRDAGFHRRAPSFRMKFTLEQLLASRRMARFLAASAQGRAKGSKADMRHPQTFTESYRSLAATSLHSLVSSIGAAHAADAHKNN
jgi:hypothetical protein